MELEFTSDQDELRASIRDVLAGECPIGLVREVVEKGVAPSALWERMVQLDWPALTVPEAAGGMGFGMVELAVLAEELGRAVTPGPLFATAALFAPAVREAGTDEQRARFLGGVAAGRMTGTLAVAEAAGDWSPAAVAATAHRDGNGWALSGSKHYVIEGGRVDEIAVAARPDDDDGGGPALFVVPAEAVRKVAHKTLDATRQIASIDLDGVVVDADRRLGTGGDATPAITRAIEEATVAFSMETVGTCEAIFDIALDYTKVREQFGVKIGSFQAMKHKFADMFVALEAARATCYFAAVAIAENDPRRALGASMAKALAGDCGRRIGQEGIQSLGGIGFTWEHDMHMYVKRVMSSGALLGTAEEHRQRVADLLDVR